MQIKAEYHAERETGPLLAGLSIHGHKDPCVVSDGQLWHIFGTRQYARDGQWGLLHAIAPEIEGPWTELPDIHPAIEGPCVAAPGMIYHAAERRFHMFVQTACFDLGGTIEHLISEDGNEFMHVDTALRSLPGTQQAGIYDGHPAEIDGERYLVYSGMPKVSRADLYLAKSSSGSWSGPWDRMGKILSHEDVFHHNQHDHDDYEWGLEGAQLIGLDRGHVLLIAVCFLAEGIRGSRQRVFFAVAATPTGPYRTLGTMVHPTDNGWGDAENGHASAVFVNDDLHLFYQARSLEGPWRYGRASFPRAQLDGLCERAMNAAGGEGPELRI